jgi:hypothetical protein
MLWCALLLWPWGTLPRETISGFFGRKALSGSRVAKIIVAFIDYLHPLEWHHCYETARMEYDARVALEYHS